jgi:L-rhamnose mutarotase
MMERVGFLLKIDSKDQQEYIKRHQAVYPELLQAFQEVGISTYSIFMHEEYLFAYMEVENYQEAMKKLDENEANQRWQWFMSDLLKKHNNGQTTLEIPEVFHFEHPEKG